MYQLPLFSCNPIRSTFKWPVFGVRSKNLAGVVVVAMPHKTTGKIGRKFHRVKLAFTLLKHTDQSKKMPSKLEVLAGSNQCQITLVWKQKLGDIS